EMEPLRQAANARAEELRSRLESLRADQQGEWSQELSSFEAGLFAQLCQQRTLTDLLPDQEHLTLVLNGLGEAEAGGGRKDRIHVLKAADLQRCLSGDINAAGLQQLAITYSY